MYAGISEALPEWLRDGLAVFGTALAVKWLDDLLDADLDGDRGLRTWAGTIGAGAAAYSLLALAAAAALRPAWVAALYLAAYGVGMVRGGPARLPSGLSPIAESLLALGLGGLLAGFRLQTGAFLTLVAVQLLDDWWDYREDRSAGPMCGRFGPWEVGGTGLAAALAAWLVTPVPALWGLGCSLAVGLLFPKRRREGEAP